MSDIRISDLVDTREWLGMKYLIEDDNEEFE